MLGIFESLSGQAAMTDDRLLAGVFFRTFYRLGNRS